MDLHSLKIPAHLQGCSKIGESIRHGLPLTPLSGDFLVPHCSGTGLELLRVPYLLGHFSYAFKWEDLFWQLTDFSFFLYSKKCKIFISLLASDEESWYSFSVASPTYCQLMRHDLWAVKSRGLSLWFS